MRNAEFDREQVLRSAMAAFLHKGYAKTSMQVLTKATGLHPGSIYCAFENKRGLLIASLEQYKQDRNHEFQQFFTEDRAVLRSLKAYIDNIVAQCNSCDTAKACLLTKSLNELAEQDEEIKSFISEVLEQWQQALAEKFEQAKLSGELTTLKDSQHLARYLVMGIYGLRTFAHTHPQSEVIKQLADQLYQDLCRE
ncbi:TetR/AcrR family transcriptional regulator [Litorilituus lipolyticus]|uniref:TetR/AcrR family transcriptional regulator n=1 Tax=Litorilituus lipolyticus TaxID=2491017 RepID=A0A502L1N0_9GAMM|nr:TetR/AcrR family transcriptional regulator [Litorilituus lipolyticus]TPH16201.1 TetR/AcrR family transcriptional regulator [Litorilituus lipolyticus]